MSRIARRSGDVSARCFHCGEANPPRSSWRAEFDGKSERFCCAGCLAVAQTIRAAGLSSFYALREQPSAPAPDDAGAASESDDAAVADMARDVAGGCREVPLLLDGLRCGACA